MQHYYIITDAIGSLSDHEGYKAGTVVTIQDKHPNDYFTVTDGSGTWYVSDGEIVEIETVEYKGTRYPIRTVVVNGTMYNVSTTVLSAALEADNHEGEAENVDNNIYFYVEPDKIGWNLRQLKAHVMKESDLSGTDIANNSNASGKHIPVNQLTEPQRKMLALLAYHCLNMYYNPHEKKFVDKADTAAHACALLNVSDSDILKVRKGYIKGLQNLNRIASTSYFTEDYDFKVC